MPTFVVPPSDGAPARATLVRSALDRSVDVEIAPPGTDVVADLLGGGFDGLVIPLPEARRTAAEHGFACQVVAREERRDVMISDREATTTLMGLDENSRVAVVGNRRLALLRASRPDVVGIKVEADVDALLARISSGDFSALVADGCTVVRTGHESRVQEWFEPTAWVPEVATGALGLLWRRDAETLTISAAVGAAVEAEEAMKEALEGTNDGIVCAMALPYGPHLRLWGLVVSPQGTRAVRADLTGDVRSAHDLGRRVAALLMARGAALTSADVS